MRHAAVRDTLCRAPTGMQVYFTRGLPEAAFHNGFRPAQQQGRHALRPRRHLPTPGPGYGTQQPVAGVQQLCRVVYQPLCRNRRQVRTRGTIEGRPPDRR